MKISYVLLAVGVLALIGIAWWSLSASPSPEEPADSGNESVASEFADSVTPAVPPLPEPQIQPSPYLNTSLDVSYVGRRKCAECHAEAHRSYLTTRHSQSMAAADEQQQQLPDAEVVHPPSGYRYATSSTPEGLVQTEQVVLPGTAPRSRDIAIDYVMGSGHFGKSFLAEQSGFLIQSPLTWYSTRQEWGLSPGFDLPGQLSFRRTVSTGCLYCHAGHTEAIEQNKYQPQIHEMAVSCERCHGPGGLHVRKHESLKSNGTRSGAQDLTIVHPRRLSRELSEAICQQCHLQGKAQVSLRGTDLEHYRPGLSLQDFRMDYLIQQTADMKVVGHVEQMHQSPCYQQSETLTCITCHNPHPGPDHTDAVRDYRATCLECHTEQSCGETPARRLAAANDLCTECHMPSAPTEVPHVAFTHHRIGIHRPGDEAGQTTPKPAVDLIPLLVNQQLSEADRQRCAGLGWLQIYLTVPDVDQQTVLQRAQESLLAAWQQGAGDAEVAAGLATIAQEIGWTEMVEQWASRALALETDPTDARTTALALLSEQQFQQQQFSAAYAGFRELTEVRRDARHWFFRGVSAQNLGRTEEAIEALNMSVTINPRNQAGHVALAALYQLTGDTQQQAHHNAVALSLLQEARAEQP